jgi:hypothetical protein
MLNEEAIAQAISAVVAHLRDKKLDQARHTIDVLSFGRLLRRARRRDKGSTEVVDPAQSFGPERVHQTGIHLRGCSVAMDREDASTALREAEAAMTRWKQRIG